MVRKVLFKLGARENTLISLYFTAFHMVQKYCFFCENTTVFEFIFLRLFILKI